MLDRMKLCRVYAQASGECVVPVQLHSNRRLSYVRTRGLSEVEMTHQQGGRAKRKVNQVSHSFDSRSRYPRCGRFSHPADPAMALARGVSFVLIGEDLRRESIAPAHSRHADSV